MAELFKPYELKLLSRSSTQVHGFTTIIRDGRIMAAQRIAIQARGLSLSPIQREVLVHAETRAIALRYGTAEQVIDAGNKERFDLSSTGLYIEGGRQPIVSVAQYDVGFSREYHQLVTALLNNVLLNSWSFSGDFVESIRFEKSGRSFTLHWIPSSVVKAEAGLSLIPAMEEEATIVQISPGRQIDMDTSGVRTVVLPGRPTILQPGVATEIRNSSVQTALVLVVPGKLEQSDLPELWKMLGVAPPANTTLAPKAERRVGPPSRRPDR